MIATTAAYHACLVLLVQVQVNHWCEPPTLERARCTRLRGTQFEMIALPNYNWVSAVKLLHRRSWRPRCASINMGASTGRI